MIDVQYLSFFPSVAKQLCEWYCHIAAASLRAPPSPGPYQMWQAVILMDPKSHGKYVFKYNNSNHKTK